MTEHPRITLTYRLVVGAAIILGLPICGYLAVRMINTYDDGAAKVIIKLDNIAEQLSAITNEQTRINGEVESLDERTDLRLDFQSQRMNGVEQRMDRIEREKKISERRGMFNAVMP